MLMSRHHWLSSEIWSKMISSSDGVFLWFVGNDITSWGSSLIGSFKAIQCCLMIGWTQPWPQFTWLVVVCASECLVPEFLVLQGFSSIFQDGVYVTPYSCNEWVLNQNTNFFHLYKCFQKYWSTIKFYSQKKL